MSLYPGSNIYEDLCVKFCYFFSNFVIDFSKSAPYKISRKPIQWKPSYSMRTDRTKLIFAFRKSSANMFTM